MFKFNKSSGQTSKLLLVLAVIVLVAVIITFLILRWATPSQKPNTPTTPEVTLPVYDQTLGDIKFQFESALDKGGILRGSAIKNSQYSYYQSKDLSVSNPGAKFIEVTVGAQNEGVNNTERGAWTIENIIDSKGRNFVPLDDYVIGAWLPNSNGCGAVLKPAFDFVDCTKIYEVSKASTGLKIRVETGKDNKSGNLSSNKIDSFLLDLVVQ
ncbi:MAG: hypothetical protein NTY04_04495 [Candidatus Staskawiczbacteria bacterium]|nr:hypothetical protein [Candidatus Staskawiczbacteria bacterium]